MITEENIEFVNWATIPIADITLEIQEKFGSSFPEIKFRLLLEKLFSKFELITDKVIYPNNKFYFIGECWYMDLIETESKNYLCGFATAFISDPERKYSFDRMFLTNFVKKVFENYFNKKIDYIYFQSFNTSAELLFNSKEELYLNLE